MKKKRKSGESSRKSKGGLSIRTRIVLFCSAFVLMILCVVYIVQIAMLGMFYQKTRFSQMSKTADVVAASLGRPGAEQTCLVEGQGTDTCILVFRVENGTLHRSVISVEGMNSCVIHSLPNEELIARYRDAVQNDGKKIYTITADSRFIEVGESQKKNNRMITSAVLVEEVIGGDGNTYAIFLNAELTPVAGMTSTLNTQFTWITIAVVCAAALISYLFSRQISQPLIKMTSKAKKLAKGDYSPNFRGEGFRETVDLAEALNYAAEEISKAENLRRELISNVSHDLRTPLTMISGYAEVMRDIPGENTPENVQMIIDEASHLTTLVNDMLDLSKIESGVKPMKPERFSLTETVRNVMQRYSQLTEHDGYTVRFEADEEAFVYADPVMMMQVVYNLTNNAVTYTGADKTVTVRQMNRLDEGGQPKVRILVSDTGAGISPENIGKIWDRYYREEGPHKRAAVGTGLGLSIVKDILQKHNAAFGVESTEGVGTTFWFELPRVE